VVYGTPHTRTLKQLPENLGITLAAAAAAAHLALGLRQHGLSTQPSRDQAVTGCAALASLLLLLCAAVPRLLLLLLRWRRRMLLWPLPLAAVTGILAALLLLLLLLPLFFLLGQHVGAQAGKQAGCLNVVCTAQPSGGGGRG
jgi:hypothetical protein